MGPPHPLALVLVTKLGTAGVGLFPEQVVAALRTPCCHGDLPKRSR